MNSLIYFRQAAQELSFVHNFFLEKDECPAHKFQSFVRQLVLLFTKIKRYTSAFQDSQPIHQGSLSST
jgi:hypothetical protein